MDQINSNIEPIPHGHGKSYKIGISDGLLNQERTQPVPSGHERSYERGRTIGEQLRTQVKDCVK